MRLHLLRCKFILIVIVFSEGDVSDPIMYIFIFLISITRRVNLDMYTRLSVSTRTSLSLKAFEMKPSEIRQLYRIAPIGIIGKIMEKKTAYVFFGILSYY